ncbi:hypothetical protein BAAM0499_03230 [Bifidobacterium animalis subsp. animalis MCC 0499]|uniref:hypothetical protein n=1 Tax=Bifidobacterium animalis TaxID=28025 RepID=UPI00069A8629|nr:hypothetical protein [Bifidobacterium animalis]KOA60904.1 hypothetical protein BAAM0499_03230 [Bifidobacterium animalis subsp. animalis MCC 0499]
MALEQLPVLRWSDVATTLENRTDGLIDYITNLFKAVPLNIEGMFLSMGNGLWSAGANLLKQSSQNESAAIQQMGKAANKMVGGSYHGLTGDWMIPAILTVFVVIASIFAVFRGQGVAVLLKRMGAFAIGLAMFLSMGAIAAAHPNTPSTGTPWWTVNLTRNVVGNTGNVLERSLQAGLQTNGTTLARKKTDPHNLNYADCRGYLYQLGNGYTNGTGNQQGSFDSLEDTMNTMWEETGLRMWIRAQYGPGENGSNVFCHVLEQRAGASSREQADTMRKAMQANDRNIPRLDLPWENALAFHADLMIAPDEGKKNADDKNPKIAASNIMLDRMTTMWDVCGYDGHQWSARKGWKWLDGVTGSERGLDGVNAGQLNAYCKAVITGNGYIPIANPSLTNNSANDNKGTKDDGNGNQHVWDVKDIGGTHDEHDKNMRKIVRKFDLSNSNTAWLNVATQEAVKNADGEGPKINEAIITMKQQHGDANLADVGGALVFAVAGLVNFLIWGVGFGVMRLLAVIMASIAAVGIWLGFIVWAVAPDKGRQTLKSSFLNMAGMCGISAILGVFAGIVCMIMNVLMTVFGIIDDNGNTAATVVVMGCASLLFPLLSVWVLRWMCVNVLKVGDPFSMGAFGKLSKSVGHGFGMVGGMLAAGTAAAVAGGSMKGIAQAAVSGIKSGSIGSAMAHGSIIGHNSGTGTPNIGGKGGGRHSGSRQPTAADRSINPQDRQAIAENRDIAPSLEKPDMSKEQHQLDDRISQLDKQTGLDAYNQLAGKYKDDPAGLAQAVQQQVDAAHKANEEQAARMLAEQAQRADITSMMKATGGNTSRKNINRYMQSAAVQEQVAAKAKQSLADRAAHQQAVRQYEDEAADYNRQKELSKTFRGRLKMTRERYQTLSEHGKAGTAAAWLATGVATAAGETARFAKQHKVMAAALALPAATAMAPLGLAGGGLAGVVGTAGAIGAGVGLAAPFAAGGVMNMAHRMMGGGYGKLSPRVRQADQSVRFQNRAAAGIATVTDRMAQQHRENQAAGTNPFTRMAHRLDRMDATLESGIGQVVTQPAQSVKSAAHRMGMAGLPEATKQVWDTPKPADSQPEPDGKPLPSTSTPVRGEQPPVPSTPAVPPADGMPAPTPPIPPVASTPAGQDAMPSAPARSQAVQPPVGHPGE